MASKRGRETARDMVLSMGLIVAFVVGTLALLGGALGTFGPDPAAREVRPVDYGDRLAAAVEGADYEVLAPGDVPDGWVPQSSRAEPPQGAGEGYLFQVGFLTDGGRFAQVVQSSAPRDDVLESQRLGDTAEGTVVVDGEAWERRSRVDRPEQALVRTEGTRTVVVTGDATAEELARLAGSLEPAGSPGAREAGGDGFEQIPG
ncbi:MAG TPA: DUF4245 domain-containing protein [Miltoncostaeaceae bacterium]|nr:DUF4245 domain-containing protein [Miltoncostaeaceae bacterium]